MPQITQTLKTSIRGCLVAVTVLAVFTNIAQAVDEVEWSTNIAESLQKSAAVDKPVLMEFTADWCVYCKRMEKTTFANPAVAAAISESFLPVRIDADQYKDLVKQLQIKGLPAILIVGSDLTILERISGFQTPEALLPKLARFRKQPSQVQPSVNPPASPFDSTSPTQFVQANRAARSTMPTTTSESAATVQPVSQARTFGDPQQQSDGDGMPRVDLFGNVPAAQQPAKSRAPVEENPFEFQAADRSGFGSVNPRATSTGDLPSAADRNPFEQPAPHQTQPAAGNQNPFAEEDFTWNSPAEQKTQQAVSHQQQHSSAVGKNPFGTSSPAQSHGGLTVAQPDQRLSFGGVCVVSAVDDREIVQGNQSVRFTYRGKQIAFRTEEYKQRFMASPEKYWPMMDGICTVTLAETGKQLQGKFEFASVFRNRIWLFTSEENMNLFLEEPAEVVEEALEQI